MMDHHAQACRTLWADVLLAVMDDFNRDYQRPKLRSDVLTRARSYLSGPDGRQVAALAGINVNV